MEMSNFDMKISIFSNWLIFDVHVGNGYKVKFHYGNPENEWANEFKNQFY